MLSSEVVVMICHVLHWSHKSTLAQFIRAKRPLGSSVVCVPQWLINESSWIIGPRPGSHLTLVTWILISHLKPILIVMYYLSYHFSIPFNSIHIAIHSLGWRKSRVCIGFYISIQPKLVDSAQQKRWKQSFFTVSF